MISRYSANDYVSLYLLFRNSLLRCLIPPLLKGEINPSRKRNLSKVFDMFSPPIGNEVEESPGSMGNLRSVF